MWGANFSDSFNITSFIIAIIVFLYLIYFYKQIYHKITDTENEDENELNKYYG
jgi:cytochrome bd-type quinol oxidase subunit 2